jgi:hypothetical protein
MLVQLVRICSQACALRAKDRKTQLSSYEESAHPRARDLRSEAIAIHTDRTAAARLSLASALGGLTILRP